MINAGAEEIQFIIGTLKEEKHDDEPKKPSTLTDLLEINKSVEHMMRRVIMKEMLLGFKLEDILNLVSSAPKDTPNETETDTTENEDEGDA
jgi:hypothetical protein